MIWFLPMALCLFGCQQDLTHYAYCAVTEVQKQPSEKGGYWVATCSDGHTVYFPRMITSGDGIYYSPYYENNDSKTMYGYIKKIEVL